MAQLLENWRRTSLVTGTETEGSDEACEAQIRDAFLEYGSAEFVSEHLIKDALEFEVKYKTEGYIGDVVPRSWDDYILSEDAELFEDFDDGVNVDIDEEDAGVEDGFAMANVE